MHPCIVRFGAFPQQPLAFPSLVVGSMNDPYMDAEELSRSASLWGSDLINLGAVGHINIASGYGRWPEGYALLERLKMGNAPAKAGTRSRSNTLSALSDAYF